MNFHQKPPGHLRRRSRGEHAPDDGENRCEENCEERTCRRDLGAADQTQSGQHRAVGDRENDTA